jgi:hypothetical protein
MVAWQFPGRTNKNAETHFLEQPEGNPGPPVHEAGPLSSTYQQHREYPYLRL